MHSPGAFPTLRAVTRLAQEASDLTGKNRTASTSRPQTDDLDIYEFTLAPNYDIKFYPYNETNDDAVFAFCTATEVFVCRPTDDAKTPIETLRVFRDPQHDAGLNSLAWSQDMVTGDPLICFGGSGSSKVKIAHVKTGRHVRNLSGHGAAINDIAISPLSPAILASASNDHSIRLWNLDPTYAHQPCAAIFGGAGHKDHVLALGFHKEGNYLLSGGSDTMINLWAVPSVPDAAAGTDKTTTVFYPLFSSTEVHSHFVDSVRFHGDLILSHAATPPREKGKEKKSVPNSILIWRIDGFSSADAVPNTPPLPVPGVATRSAFGPPGSRFHRLLTLDMPNTTPFYMRFSLFDNLATASPMLVMGNERSRFSFWDLRKLKHGADAADLASATVGVAKKHRGQTRDADGADVLRAAVGRNKGVAVKVDHRTEAGDPFAPIPPHHTLTVPRYNFASRQCAWSNDGKWCIAVGEIGLMVVMKRWD